MEKPSLQLRKQFRTDYYDKSVFAANARLLQSIWREEQGIPLKRAYGNFLDSDQAYCQKLNFLSQKIRNIVQIEIEKNEYLKGKNKKVIKKDRLYENLLSSQPLAFNLFSEFITPDYEIADKVFKKLFGNRIQKITSIEYEYSPGRSDLKYTGDRSAFDVFIRYEGVGKGFIGIEIKYAETLFDDPAKFKNRYKEVAAISDKFWDDGIAALSKMPVSLEQIWRDHLLSLSMLPPINNDFGEGFFIYLFPKDNSVCESALNRYFSFLKFKNPIETGLHLLYMEDFVKAIKEETNEKWIFDFEDRYLKFDKIDRQIQLN